MPNYNKSKFTPELRNKLAEKTKRCEMSSTDVDMDEVNFFLELQKKLADKEKRQKKASRVMQESAECKVINTESEAL